MTNAVNIAQSGSNNQTMRNRIINGAMVIDQRNNGASVNISGGAYTVDRWEGLENGSMAFTVQQSTVVPSSAGFTNSVLITTTTAASPGSTDRSQFEQYIEGYNIADLSWGTASAQPVTLSFWVRSSLTGQFGGALANGAGNRAYPYSYTISAANTWEYKTITVPGDTSGTWNTTNGRALCVYFDLGMGSSLLGTAGAWAGSDFRGATGDVQLSANSGATFYLTGVQLEEGTAASPFENRLITTELSLCQRYCFVFDGKSAFSNAFSRYLGVGNGTNQFLWMPQYPVMMRTPPTLFTSNLTAGNLDLYNYSTAAGVAYSSISLGEGDVVHGQVTFFATSGISSGHNCSWRWNGNPNASIGFSAEL
jgi:hypothetical protein